MSGTGATAKKAKAKATSQSKRAGLVWSVGRTGSVMKSWGFLKRHSPTAEVYAAAVMQHVMSEVLELAAKCATDKKKAIIKPRHLMLAMHKDPDLERAFRGVHFCGSGAQPTLDARDAAYDAKHKHKHKRVANEVAAAATTAE